MGNRKEVACTGGGIYTTEVGKLKVGFSLRFFRVATSKFETVRNMTPSKPGRNLFIHYFICPRDWGSKWINSPNLIKIVAGYSEWTPSKSFSRLHFKFHSTLTVTVSRVLDFLSSDARISTDYCVKLRWQKRTASLSYSNFTSGQNTQSLKAFKK